MLTPATAKGYSHSALVPSLLFNNLWNESCQPKNRFITMSVLELATKIIFTTSNTHKIKRRWGKEEKPPSMDLHTAYKPELFPKELREILSLKRHASSINLFLWSSNMQVEPTNNGQLRAHRIQKPFIENVCTSRKSHIKHDGHLDICCPSICSIKNHPKSDTNDYTNTIFYSFQGHKT